MLSQKDTAHTQILIANLVDDPSHQVTRVDSADHENSSRPEIVASPLRQPKLTASHIALADANRMSGLSGLHNVAGAGRPSAELSRLVAGQDRDAMGQGSHLPGVDRWHGCVSAAFGFCLEHRGVDDDSDGSH